MESRLSVKKNTQDDKKVDPLAAVFLASQVRDLLRFHQTMGISGYPADNGLSDFLQSNIPVAGKTLPLPGGTKVRAAEVQTMPGSRKNVFQTPAPPGAKISTPQVPPPAAPSLKAIIEEINLCKACTLAEKRQGQVAGIGSTKPKLMVVGDWSQQNGVFSDEVLFGIEEDVMLWRMMEAIGLSGDEVYVTNGIKCCPVGGEGEPVSGEHCFAHLGREIAVLKPGLILAMGELATHLLLGVAAPLVRLRGRFHPYRYPDSAPARVMPTFHPRFLLAHQEMKKMVWQDLQMIQRQLTP